MTRYADIKDLNTDEKVVAIDSFKRQNLQVRTYTLGLFVNHVIFFILIDLTPNHPLFMNYITPMIHLIVQVLIYLFSPKPNLT